MPSIAGIVSRKPLNQRSAAINQVNNSLHQENSLFNFRLFHPKGEQSSYVQALWSASVSQESLGDIKRWLQGDACSGILFNLGSTIYLDDIECSSKVILLPVSKEAHSITLPPNSQLAGIRFHPGVGTAILENDSPRLNELQTIVEQLMNTPEHYARMSIMYKWIKKIIHFPDVIPASLLRSLNVIPQAHKIGAIANDVALSQRQLERQYQKWVGMPPKQYQRIIRVKNTINALKNNPNTDLVELAIENGFTDQAHMTREFKQIAKITPKRFSNLIINRGNLTSSA